MRKRFFYSAVFLPVFATVITDAAAQTGQVTDPEAPQLENIKPAKRFVAEDNCMTFPARCDRASVYCNKELPGTCRREDTGLWSRDTDCQDYVSVYGPCMPSGLYHHFVKTMSTHTYMESQSVAASRAGGLLVLLTG